MSLGVGAVFKKYPKLRRVLKFSLPLFALLFLYGFVYEPHLCLVVKKWEIPAAHWSKDLDGLKIALVSDIHMGSFPFEERRVRRVVEAVNAQKPDLIALGGDFVNGHRWNTGCDLEKLAAILKDLKAPLGVFAVTGNHDELYGSAKIIDSLSKVGIKFLENEGVKISTKNGEFYMAGIPSMASNRYLIARSLLNVPRGASCIFLVHEPDLMPALPLKASVVLSGHTHGGQVALPLIGPLIRPETMDFGARDGLFVNYRGIPMLVSRGVGTSNMGVRFLTKPQIEIIELKSAKKN